MLVGLAVLAPLFIFIARPRAESKLKLLLSRGDSEPKTQGRLTKRSTPLGSFRVLPIPNGRGHSRKGFAERAPPTHQSIHSNAGRLSKFNFFLSKWRDLGILPRLLYTQQKYLSTSCSSAFFAILAHKGGQSHC